MGSVVTARVVGAARLCLILLPLVTAATAGAVPPGAAVTAATLPGARWIEHRVVPGERIKEIAEYYAVSPRKVIAWNDLDRDRPWIRAGQKLRIWTRAAPVERRRKLYRVRRGDSWSRIANRFDVEVHKLRNRWNRRHEGKLQRGQRIAVWVRVEPEPAVRLDAARESEGRGERAGARQPDPRMPEMSGGESIGAPGRGRLRRGIRLPKNEGLYTIRRPAHAYGSSHTITNLVAAISVFRSATGYEGELLVADISRRRGGRFRPHTSHRSGRDVDIRLPLREGMPEDTIPRKASQVDWDATWALVKALVDTEEVKYIFLSRPRQRNLRRAALRAGASEAEVDGLIQFPDRTRTTIVRHSRGHTEHIHVRFECGPTEARCRD